MKCADCGTALEKYWREAYVIRKLRAEWVNANGELREEEWSAPVLQRFCAPSCNKRVVRGDRQ